MGVEIGASFRFEGHWETGTGTGTGVLDRTHRVMRLAQAGCMTTPSDVPRSQTEIGTKYVAANSLIYPIWARSIQGPSIHPPLFLLKEKKSREETVQQQTNKLRTRPKLHAYHRWTPPGRLFNRPTREAQSCVCICVYVRARLSCLRWVSVSEQTMYLPYYQIGSMYVCIHGRRYTFEALTCIRSRSGHLIQLATLT